MQFGLARAIAAHGVDMDAGTNHVVGKDRRVLLVRRHRCDDVGAFDRLLTAGANGDLEALPCEIGRTFAACGNIDVIKA